MTRKAQPLRIIPRAGDVYEHRHIDGKLYRFAVRAVVDGGGLVDGVVEYDRYVREGRKRKWDRGRALKMRMADWKEQARKALKEKQP